MLYVLSRKGGWEFHSAQCDSKLSVYKGGNETRRVGAAVGATFIPSLASTLTQQIEQVPWNGGGGFGGATGRRGGAHQVSGLQSLVQDRGEPREGWQRGVNLSLRGGAPSSPVKVIKVRIITIIVSANSEFYERGSSFGKQHAKEANKEVRTSAAVPWAPCPAPPPIDCHASLAAPLEKVRDELLEAAAADGREEVDPLEEGVRLQHRPRRAPLL